MSKQQKLTLHSGQLQASGQSRREYKCRFVRAGQVMGADKKPSNLFIEPTALSSAWGEGQFDGRAVFVDHAGWLDSNPSLHNLVAVTLNSAYNELEQTVDGVVKFYDTPPANIIMTLLDEILAEGIQAPDVGLSLVFWPVFAPRDSLDQPRRIIGIKHIESIDLVFQPAADGRILQALSAMNLPSPSGEGQEGEEDISNEDLIISLDKFSQHVTQLIQDYERKENLPMPENQETIPDWNVALATTASKAIIAASGLPQASRQRLSNQTFTTPEEVEAAISAEKTYLAALQADNVIQIGGAAPRSPHISMGRTGLEQVSSAFEAMMLGVMPPAGIQPLTGVRELYHLLSGDYEMTGMFQGERIYLANVTSSTMAQLVANALNKVVVNEFMKYPQWWLPITQQMDFANLQAVRWVTLGGIGELPTVAEGAAYTELTWDDSYETATFYKKGGYLGLTLEAIDKDDTGRIRAAPRALAQAAWLTLAKGVSGIFTSVSGTGPTMIDTGVLFNATAVSTTGGHANLGTSPLSYTAWVATRLAMRKQAELNSSERLGALTAPKFLLVPPDLEITALQVLASAGEPGVADNDINPFAEGDSHNALLAAARQRVIVVDLWTDTNNWAAVCDPLLHPTIGIGFRYGRTPEIFSVASPTAGLMFTNDTMPIKVRFFFATGPIDWRGMYKHNVS